MAQHGSGRSPSVVTVGAQAGGFLEGPTFCRAARPRGMGTVHSEGGLLLPSHCQHREGGDDGAAARTANNRTEPSRSCDRVPPVLLAACRSRDPVPRRAPVPGRLCRVPAPELHGNVLRHRRCFPACEIGEDFAVESLLESWLLPSAELGRDLLPTVFCLE